MKRERERERGINSFKSFLTTTILLFSLVLGLNASAEDKNYTVAEDIEIEEVGDKNILFNISGSGTATVKTTITTTSTTDDAFKIQAGTINLEGATIGTVGDGGIFSITNGTINFSNGINKINSAGAFNMSGGIINFENQKGLIENEEPVECGDDRGTCSYLSIEVPNVIQADSLTISGSTEINFKKGYNLIVLYEGYYPELNNHESSKFTMSGGTISFENERNLQGVFEYLDKYEYNGSWYNYSYKEYSNVILANNFVMSGGLISFKKGYNLIDLKNYSVYTEDEPRFFVSKFNMSGGTIDFDNENAVKIKLHDPESSDDYYTNGWKLYYKWRYISDDNYYTEYPNVIRTGDFDISGGIINFKKGYNSIEVNDVFFKTSIDDEPAFVRIGGGTFNMSGDSTINFYDGYNEVSADANLNMTGGTINFIGGTNDMGADQNINISNATIYFKGGNTFLMAGDEEDPNSEDEQDSKYERTGVRNGSSSAFKITSGGKIELNSNGKSFIASGSSLLIDGGNGDNISGGEIEIVKGSNNAIFLNVINYVGDGQVDSSNGVIIKDYGNISINAGASLVIKKYNNLVELENTSPFDLLDNTKPIYNSFAKADIVLDGANTKIDLSGTLDSNVMVGDTTAGTLNILNANAIVTGDVSGVNLVLGYTGNTDRTIKDIIKGNTSNLASITVNEDSILNLGTESLVTTGAFTVNEGAKVTLYLTGNYTNGSANTITNGSITANTYSISNSDTTLVINGNFNIASGEEQLVAIFKGAGVSSIVEGSNYFNTVISTFYNFEYEEDGVYRITKKSASETVAGINDALSSTISSSGTSSNTAANTQGVVNAWFGASSSDPNNGDSVALANSTVGTKLRALAGGLDTADPVEKNKAVGKLKDALVALAPDAAPTVQSNATSTLNTVTSAVGGRLTGGSSSGLSSGDFSDISKNVWIQGLYNSSEFSSDEETNNFKANTSGVAIGLEGKFNDTFTAGISYANTKSDINSYLRNTDVLTNTFVLYGEYKPYNLFVNGIIAYGISNYKEKKTVDVDDNYIVNANYDVNISTFQVGTGYEIINSIVNITPVVNLRYVNVNTKEYTDSTGMQHISSNKITNLTVLASVRFDKEFSIDRNSIIRPEFKIGITHDLVNKADDIIVTLGNNGNSSYTIKGEELNSTSFEIGLGVTGNINDKFILSINYDGQFRKDYVDNTVLFRVGFNF
jgi:outer membrane autotransporter protein